MVPEVQDPNSSPKPSIERLVGTVHSMGGRIGTHMSLRVPLRNSVVRQWG
jgi:hypothetical protein